MAAHRLLFYSHDTFGLGHFRRSLNIASHLRRKLPNVSVLILTGLETAYAFDTPPGIDFVKLPAVKKVGPDEYRSRHLRVSFHRVRRLREHLIKTVAKTFDPQLVVVDNVPRGVDGELLPTLEFLRQHRPDTRIVLTLRDVLDEPEQIVPLWRDWDVFGVLERLYDEVWVAGAQALFDPTRLYEFPAVVAEKTRFCGYIVQHANEQAMADIQQEFRLDGQPLAVVSGGGGGDAYPVLRAYTDALDAITAAGLKTAMFLGPDLPPAQRTELKRLLLPRSGDLLLFDFRPDLVSFLPHAAVTVSMAGYNTIAELLAHEKRAVVVPRVYPRREQWLRAHTLQDLGLLRCIDPERLSPEAIVEAIGDVRGPARTPSASIDFGGLRRITRAARRLLDIPEESKA